MIRKKTFRYRLKPSRKIRTAFACFSGCCRWVYNFALNAKRLAYEELDQTLSLFDLNNLLPILKREEETQWLAGIHSQVLQQSLHDLNRAYENFFRRVKSGEKPGFPKFKRKGTGDSFRYPQGVKIKDNQVYLPKIGWVRFKKSREIEGTIKQTTVIREASHWYVCFSCEIEVNEPKPSLSPATAIGIDVGLSTFATIAEGESDLLTEIANPRFLRGGLEKLRFLSRQLSKKKFKSANWFKARHKLQQFQASLKNRRKDFAHKLSTLLVKNHDIVGIESLSIQSMLQKGSSKLSRSIADAGWGQFLSFLRYKVEYAGKLLVEADRWFASTKQCSKCHRKREMKLSDRVFKCECGYEVGRDANAAVNLKNIAIEQFQAVGTTV
jgi:putative transposase